MDFIAIFAIILIVALVLGLTFLSIFFIKKSIETNSNLYGIPAMIIFLCFASVEVTEVNYYGYSAFSTLRFMLTAMIAYPLLAIFVFTKAKKQLLVIPFVIFPLAPIIKFIEYSEYYKNIDIFFLFCFIMVYASLIYLTFTETKSKNIFFIPAVFCFLTKIELFEYYSNVISLIIIMAQIGGFMLLGKYIVTNNTENTNNLQQ